MDNEEFKEHQCSALPGQGVYIVFSRNGTEGFFCRWNLVIRRVSTEETLEQNHYIEQVGETLWETVLEISNCPYCGKALNATGGGSCEGNFKHRDYAGWSVEIQ